jgi:hypothetical protein
METRLYIIRNKKTGEARIIEASTAAAAIKHVVSDSFRVEVGKAKEVALLMSEGVKHEQIRPAPQNMTLPGLGS